jgi:hypothetical protein
LDQFFEEFFPEWILTLMYIGGGGRESRFHPSYDIYGKCLKSDEPFFFIFHDFSYSFVPKPKIEKIIPPMPAVRAKFPVVR